MRVDVVVIGGGPAGLAMSAHLAGAGIGHVVLERGEIASSWRTERWDSLRLLTPNWMTALPGFDYRGDDPDGFMTAADTVARLDEYASAIAPPLRTHVTVEAVRRRDDGFDVLTDDGAWTCDAVVAATGASSEARVPGFAAELPPSIQQMTALQYRRPSQLTPDGDVLVVGASASGVQIADELCRAGRAVTIAVGEHVRLPRSYRGRDIYSWLDAIGQLDEQWHEVADLDRARRHASIQVVGSDDRHDVDLETLRAAGVRSVGRVAAVVGHVAQCSGGLGSLVSNADLKQTRMLERIDRFVLAHGLTDAVGPSTRPCPTDVSATPTEIDLRAFGAVVFATGYRPTYRWLDRTAFDRRGRVAHDGGVGRVPGLFLLGLPFLRRRRSNLLSGLGRDAGELLPHIRAHLDDAAARRALV